jgi:hypothetical protein
MKEDQPLGRVHREAARANDLIGEIVTSPICVATTRSGRPSRLRSARKLSLEEADESF